jgi:hypothetical protein
MWTNAYGVGELLHAAPTTDWQQYFGVVTCRVTPPTNLHFGLLPCRIGSELCFPLCYKCAVQRPRSQCTCSDAERSFSGCFCTPELLFACEYGYQVCDVYEVSCYCLLLYLHMLTDYCFQIYYYAEQSTQIFASYFEQFASVKIHASKPPERLAEFRTALSEFKIELKEQEIRPNRQMYSISKLLLNTLWVSCDHTHPCAIAYTTVHFRENSVNESIVAHNSYTTKRNYNACC